MQFKIYVFLSLLIVILMACQSNHTKQNKKEVSLLRHSTVQDTSTREALKIAYAGNMGVCIEHEDKTVLIDGLHKFYNKEYVFPTEDLVNRLIDGHFKDFTSIEFCLFTHLHGDHFSGSYSKTFLEHNLEGIVIGSYQIKEGIAKNTTKTDSISNRIMVAPYNWRPLSVEKPGVEVTAIRCDHANPEYHGKTENIAYLISMNDYKILHVGDTDWDATEEALQNLDIKKGRLDIAILPYWLLLEWGAKTKVQQLIAPKHIIATHIPPNFKARYREQLHKKFSNITLFTKLEEVHYYSK